MQLSRQFEYKEFRRQFRLSLAFEISKFICFAEAYFMIKQAFVFHSPSVEKAGGEEALWLCALLHSSHWDKEPPVRGGKA